MVTRLGVSAELIPANSRTTVTAVSEMRRYMFPPQNLPENRRPTVEVSVWWQAVSEIGSCRISSRDFHFEFPSGPHCTSSSLVLRQSGKLGFQFEPARASSSMDGNNRY